MQGLGFHLINRMVSKFVHHNGMFASNAIERENKSKHNFA